MKTILVKRIFLLCVIIFGFLISTAQSPCPNYGDASGDPAKATFNKKKNRIIRTSGAPEFLPLRNLLPTRQRSDFNLYWEGAYVYTEGILTSAEEQGPESCNCKQAREAAKNGDVHMFLSLVDNAPKKNSLVVEITPAFKKKYPDYKSLLTKHKKVRVYGFLFYDYEHEDVAFTTCKHCNNIWRKSCWEIHPITKIELVNAD